MASTPRQGAVALRTGGVYCAHIYSDEELGLGCCGGPGAVATTVVQRVPGRAGSWSRAWTGARGLTGSRESLHLAAGRDPGGGPRERG